MVLNFLTFNGGVRRRTTVGVGSGKVLTEAKSTDERLKTSVTLNRQLKKTISYSMRGSRFVSNSHGERRMTKEPDDLADAMLRDPASLEALLDSASIQTLKTLASIDPAKWGARLAERMRLESKPLGKLIHLKNRK